MAGGISGMMKESVQRAFSYLQAKKTELGIVRDLETSDLHVEVIDLLGNRVEAEVGVAFFVASYSALRKAPVSPALLILGDMSVQGNIKPLRSLTEPLQVAKDNGAKPALIPIENKRNFLDVPADIMEHVDPIFCGDPETAAMKVLRPSGRRPPSSLLTRRRAGDHRASDSSGGSDPDPRAAKVLLRRSRERRQLADVAHVVLNDDGCLQVGGDLLHALDRGDRRGAVEVEARHPAALIVLAEVGQVAGEQDGAHFLQPDQQGAVARRVTRRPENDHG